MSWLMKNLWPYGAAAGIVVTIVLAGMLAMPRRGPEAVRAAGPENSRTRSEKVRDEDDERWKGFVARARAVAPDDKTRWAELLASVAPEDRMKALMVLDAVNVKGKGMPYHVEELMGKIVEAWAKEDFEEAWEAISRLSNKSVARRLKGDALGVLAQSDPERVCELHQAEASTDKWFFSRAPEILLYGKLGGDAGEYVRWMEKLGHPAVGGADFGKFAADFDFQTAADHAAAQTAADGLPNKSLPVNFLHEWAKKDPAAAFDWWASNRLVYSSLSGIAEAVERQSPGSAGAWLAERLPEPGPLRERFLQELGAAYPGNKLFNLEAIAGAMPDSRASDAFLTDYLVANAASLPLREPAIGSMSSAEVRLEALRAMASVNPSIKTDWIPDTRLQEWGVTREQLQQIFPGKNR